MSISAPRVLLIGWEAADWQVIQPLLEDGSLPALEGLIRNGVMGDLRSLYPTSPNLLWTSLLTGKAADKHGIFGPFALSRTLNVSASNSLSRRAKALWNLTSERDLPTHAIGWPGAYPAEAIHGIFVSPQYVDERVRNSQAWTLAEGCISPPQLKETLAPLRIATAEIPPSALLELVPLALKADQRYDDRLGRIAAGLAAMSSIHNAATWSLEQSPWRFASVYYNAIGYFSHLFMRYRGLSGEDARPEDREIYSDVVPNVYRFQDRMLARLLEIAGPDTIVVLVSDHGFRSGADSPRRSHTTFDQQSAWRREYGILCVSGPGIRKDELVFGAGLLDVAPTILSMLGLPVGRDMDGRVLRQIFRQPPAALFCSSWEESAGEEGGANDGAYLKSDSVMARGLSESFIALDRTDSQLAGSSNIGFDLASVYMSSARPTLALPILQSLTEAAPESLRYQRALVQCCLAAGRVEQAEEILSRLLAGREICSWMHLYWGVIHMHRKEEDVALAAFQMAEQTATGIDQLSTFISSAIGDVYLAKKLWYEAEQAYTSALRTDSENANAHAGLASIRLKQRRNEEAAACALKAVQLRYDHVNGHYCLGVAMARLGYYERAAAALEVALSLAPDHPRALRYLIRLRVEPQPLTMSSL